MSRFLQRCLLAAATVLTLSTAGIAADPKPGGILKLYHRDSPGSPSILEESSNSVTTPFMAMFNNLVLYDQEQPRNSIETIQPLMIALFWSCQSLSSLQPAKVLNCWRSCM